MLSTVNVKATGSQPSVYQLVGAPGEMDAFDRRLGRRGILNRRQSDRRKLLMTAQWPEAT
jgi:hypothetical protein